MYEGDANLVGASASGSLLNHKGIEIMDAVRFSQDVVGKAPLTEKVVEVREGTEGTVTRISPEGFFTVEVPSLESAMPLCFVDVDIDLISLVPGE